MITELGKRISFSLFIGALIVYAIFGSATPDNPGLVELIVAMSLLVSSFYGIFSLIRDIRNSSLSPVKISALILFVYGFLFSLPVSVIIGNDIDKIIRDIIAFLFLLMPLFFTDLIYGSERHKKILIFVVCLSGLIFSLRCLVIENVVDFDFNILKSASDELLYLANSPFVLFSAVALAGYGLCVLAENGYSFRAVSIAVFLIALSLFPLMSMASVLQRAGIGYFVFSYLILSFYYIYKCPARILPFLCCFSVLIFMLIVPYASQLYDVFYAKTSSVGSNNRINEAIAVIDEINNSGYSGVLFGLGWGGEFNSPAVGEVKVNFTHSLLTSMLLKTGVIGMFLCIAYLLCIADNFLYQAKKNTVLFFAVAGPILIGVFLYANYKSTDFGIMLLLASLSFAKQKPALRNKAGF